MIENRNDIKLVGGNMNRNCILMDGWQCIMPESVKPHFILPCRQCIISRHHKKKMSIEQQDTVKEQEHIYIAFGLITVLFLLLTFHL